ncbi:LysR family transcriptional regulator [Cohnella thailandensis]|uniref:LysR family transcriptional regulator n=1 Tax=Cohnella thailandensis TaxID=557557 RepID=A0A841T598_9BACL|nr:LysR family transcriptional regulator [Cohnella thailandensis]MBB6637037.1 LysR family transcriptional regulator [Cohnella thailandensis]MBP1973079.1 DNA-binding transcriptional LysR family regulator [Cohnella thailandensis]
MELLQLHYFRTVAKYEHMTKAAEELRIAQPALSKTISRLEEDVGVPLFDRHNRQIRLNRFGRAFLQQVETALGALEDGRRELADMAGKEQGTIRLATPTLNRLSSSISAFRKENPEMMFRVVQIPPAASDDMISLLERGEVDLCFIAASLKQPWIREMTVLKAEVCLAVPIGHRLADRSSVALDEVMNEAFIEYHEEHPFRQLNNEYCRNAGIDRQIICEVDEPSALWSLVQAGLGLAFTPRNPNAVEDENVKLLRIDKPACEREFAIAWNEKRYLPNAARSFVEFLESYFHLEPAAGDKSR